MACDKNETASGHIDLWFSCVGNVTVMDMTVSNVTVDPPTDDEPPTSTVEIVFKCFVVHLISVLGIVGNAFNIVVLRRHGLNNSTNLLLLSMSLMDLLQVLTTPIRRSTCLISRYHPAAAVTITAIDRAFLAVPNRVVGIISASHIALISIERTVAVYFPFRVHHIFSFFNTKICLAVTYIFWISLCSPFLFLFKFSWKYDDQFQQMVGHTVYSQFFTDNFNNINVYNSMIISNVRGPVLVITVLFCSISTDIRLFQASKTRAVISSKKAGVDFRVVRMLLVVSSVYLLIGIPVSMAYLYFYIFPQAMTAGSTMSKLYNILNSYVSDLYTLNASVNFIIYVTMSAKFLKTWTAVLKCQP